MANIGETILSQLGGRKFTVMTGAKAFASSSNGLTFKLPGGGGYCKDNINHVDIALTPDDLYIMTFRRVRGSAVKEIRKFEGIFFDQLTELFEEATGLRTSL